MGPSAKLKRGFLGLLLGSCTFFCCASAQADSQERACCQTGAQALPPRAPATTGAFAATAALPNLLAQADVPAENKGLAQDDQELRKSGEREAVFVNYLLIACSVLGLVIAVAVWRSLPPKSKTPTRGAN